MTLPLYKLEFDTQGQAAVPSQTQRLIAEGDRLGITDLIFLAHGFRCDAAEATDLYTRLLANLTPNLAADDRTFGVASVYWPSQRFRESFGTVQSARASLADLQTQCPETLAGADSILDRALTSRGAQDDLVASVLAAFDDGSSDPTEGLPLLHGQRGSDLLDALCNEPAAGFPAEEGGIQSVPFIRPIHAAIDTFLNFMSWTAMKNLSGSVGANGLAATLLAVQRDLSKVRIHLTGHSLGGRLVAACCKSLALQSAAPIASLSLLEAAFSHFGFSPDAGAGQPGFFRNVIEGGIVRGPIISTLSKQDAVVGKAYAVASRLAHDSLQGIGDATDPYGGIGHNGAQRTPESACLPLHVSGQPYCLTPDIVNCLDGSGGLIAGHGDVTNPHVTYAIASAINRQD